MFSTHLFLLILFNRPQNTRPPCLGRHSRQVKPKRFGVTFVAADGPQY